ncbi:MAG: hypothetical protein K8R69_02390 [Deltaproteobacteria bacterium]|nr:hypothetical protein [Deltaproteobacteria bacterium]
MARSRVAAKVIAVTTQAQQKKEPRRLFGGSIVLIRPVIVGGVRASGGCGGRRSILDHRFGCGHQEPQPDIS